MRTSLLLPALALALAPAGAFADPQPLPTQRYEAPAPGTGATTAPRSGATTAGAETTAKITDVDHEKGEVEVELSNGEEMTLKLPPSALAGFQKGDPVVISSRISMAELPNQSIPRADEDR